MLKFSQLEKITQGKLIQYANESEVTVLITDSRKLAVLPGAIFIAIKGEIHDGHDHIPKLWEAGIRQFIVEAEVDKEVLKDSNILKVANSIHAIQKMAAFHREQFNIPVIGITGSNGKTIVKEWLSQLLSAKLNVIKSPKSYNSQLGVPLSVWHMSSEHQIGLFEAGISTINEMHRIQSVMKPTIGIFTNIGSAHDKGFKDQVEKIKEKTKLFASAQVVICSKDHEEIYHQLGKSLASRTKIYSWSMHQEADVMIKHVHDQEAGKILELETNGQRLLFSIPFQDKASIENIINCICVCLYLNFSSSLIQEGISGLNQLPMRLALKQGVNGCYVIDDTYNNDYVGLTIALDFLMHQNQKPKKTLILSDILEAGLTKETLYRRVAELVKAKFVNRFIGIGPDITQYKSLFEGDAIFYESKAAFLREFNTEDYAEEIILIKGARHFALEELVARLQRRIHGTVMEINLDAMTNNLNYFRSKLHPGTKLLVMIKAFAYGSGFLEIANLLQFHRVDYLGVAYPDEGVILRQNGITLPIMVMNASPETFPNLIQYQLEPEMFSINQLSKFIQFLRANGKSSKIHIKLETGMNRLGFEANDMPELLSLLKGANEIDIASIFSHLAASEDDRFDEFSASQFRKFEKSAGLIEEELGIKTLKHILKSSGISRFPNQQYDMVRLGIGLHGIGYNEEVQKELEPVASLKTTISYIKNVKAGETIGYDRRGEALEDKKIATIAIGYADGFDRRFSRGKGKVLINGKLAPVIGNICMDMSMIDVTGIKANEGDEVIIFGGDLPLTKIAASIDTIPYEILTKVSDRVKKVFYMVQP